tara:strand:+ start:278 stop:589 length:312 start_codon:yes stop_codon:yes gene_type:complete
MTKLAKYLPLAMLILLLVFIGCKKDSESAKQVGNDSVELTVTTSEIPEDPNRSKQEVSSDCDCEKDEDQRVWKETEKRLKDRMDCLERSRLSLEKGGEGEWCP